MPAYAVIDVHRKRSRVATASRNGAIRVNRNVHNGPGIVMKVLADLPEVRWSEHRRHHRKYPHNPPGQPCGAVQQARSASRCWGELVVAG
jgi:hypothetical protein